MDSFEVVRSATSFQWCDMDDDCALSTYEWTDFLESQEALDIQQPTKSGAYFFIILSDGVCMFERNGYEAALYVWKTSSTEIEA